jgi:hypothetical protein
MKPKLKAPGTKRLKLNYDAPLSSVAFNFNLLRCTKAAKAEANAEAKAAAEAAKAKAAMEAAATAAAAEAAATAVAAAEEEAAVAAVKAAAEEEAVEQAAAEEAEAKLMVLAAAEEAASAWVDVMSTEAADTPSEVPEVVLYTSDMWDAATAAVASSAAQSEAAAEVAKAMKMNAELLESSRRAAERFAELKGSLLVGRCRLTPS